MCERHMPDVNVNALANRFVGTIFIGIAVACGRSAKSSKCDCPYLGIELPK